MKGNVKIEIEGQSSSRNDLAFSLMPDGKISITLLKQNYTEPWFGTSVHAIELIRLGKVLEAMLYPNEV